MRITFPASHPYPGSRADVSGMEDGASQALVEFGDGATAIAGCRVEGDTVRLKLPAYRTAHGTVVAARCWELRRRDGGWRARPLAQAVRRRPRDPRRRMPGGGGSVTG